MGKKKTSASTPSSSKSTPASKPAAPSSSVDVVGSLTSVAGTLVRDYRGNTAPKIALIDAFMAGSVAVAVVLCIYVFLAGTYPFNAFLAALSASVGISILFASLRTQITDHEAYPTTTEYQALAEFLICAVILLFAAINFVG